MAARDRVLDYKKELKHLYGPSTKEFAVVNVPPLEFLMVDGRGDPNTELSYQEAIEALYGMAYALKFMSKKELGKDYVVPPLEGLWWADNVASFAVGGDKGAWNWTMMILQPDWITQDMFERAAEQVQKKKNPPALPKLRLKTYDEGLAVQIMYIGPYDAEGPTIARLHQFMAENGYEPAGRHHEVYLSSPRHMAPEKLKTVLRQPVRRV